MKGNHNLVLDMPSFFIYRVHMTHIGLRIKQLRIDLGLTQEQLADKLGKNISWVKNAETRTKRFSIEDVINLAAALKIDPRQFNRIA